MSEFKRINTVRLFIILVLFCTQKFLSQNTKYEVNFSASFGPSPLTAESYYHIGVNDSIQFSTLKFYVSAIELWKEDKLIWKENINYRLIDLIELKGQQFFLNVDKLINFDVIKFDLGIDSVTNVSGALGGDLDPTKGMYWTWQSGYVNFKLEGKSNLCNTRHNEFVFHLGGYQNPFLGVQKIKRNALKGDKIYIYMDVKELIGSIDLRRLNHIMSPGKEAVILAEKVAQSIKLK